MAVLKQISPTHVPVAPKDSPSKYRPSSRAMSARTSPRSIICAGEFSNSLNVEMLSFQAESKPQHSPERFRGEARLSIPEMNQTMISRDPSTSLRFAQDDGNLAKNPDRIF